jgi:tetratricopeptide (TPR) repeat protein
LQASARFRLGEHLAYTDRLAEAEPILVKASADLEAVPEGLVPPWEPKYDAAACYWDLGYIWVRAGRFDDAHTALRKALAHFLRAAREYPNSATWHALLWSCARLEWVGLQAGDVEDAVRAHREVDALWKELVEAHPADPVVGQLAALAFNDTGVCLARLGRLEEADGAYAEGQAIVARWEKDAPFEWKFGNTYFIGRDWQGWAFIQENRADLRLLAGHPEDAAEAYRRRVDWCRRRLDVARPSATANRRAVAEALRELAGYLDRLGRPLESVTRAYRESIAAFGEIARDVPAEPEYRGAGAKARMELASVLQRAGRAEEANALADEALDIRRAIAKSGKPIDQGGLAETLSDHALVRGRTGRTGEGLADLDEAAALLMPSAADGASSAEALTALARVQDRRGRLLGHAGRLPEAEAAYTQAVALCERLARDASEYIYANRARRAAHGDSLATLGRFHRRHGQTEPAARRFAAARTGYEHIAASFAGAGAAQYYLARFLATCPDKSLRDPARAIRVAEKGVALGAGTDSFGVGVLGVAQCQVGDDRAALANLDQAARLNGGHPHPEWLFFRAQARWRLGQKDAARRDYDEAIRLMAFDDEDWSALGQYRQEAAAVLGIEDKGLPDP